LRKCSPLLDARSFFIKAPASSKASSAILMLSQGLKLLTEGLPAKLLEGSMGEASLGAAHYKALACLN